MKKDNKENKKENKKKIQEPQYLLTSTNMQALNYKVHNMSIVERILNFSIAFVVGAMVAYLFYGGIGKDEFNEPTRMTHIINFVVCITVGIIAGKFYLPIKCDSIIKKRNKLLKIQFRELLDSLATSVGSGKTVIDSFHDAYEDLQILFTKDSYIVKELEIINNGLNNNINIEVMLLEFGDRSGIDDISSFANVFDTCYRKGGNIKDVIKSTHQIITEKMEIEQEIETIVTGSKTEQKIMMIMPIALIGIIKVMSPEFAHNFVTVTGIASTTIAIIMFVIAYFVGREVLDIKI